MYTQYKIEETTEILFRIVEDVAIIDQLYVPQELRRTGVGTRMVRSLANSLVKNNAYVNYIEVLCTASSRIFWKKAGFHFKNGKYKSERMPIDCIALNER